MWQPNRKPSSFPKTVFALIAFCLIFIGGILIAADLKCSYDIANWWDIPYPGAATVSIAHDDWIRPRALFETVWVLHTPDEFDAVRQWYIDLTMQVLDDQEAGTRSRGLATTSRQLKAAENGGTIITLYSSCAM